MCCERLQEGALNAYKSLPPGHPDGGKLCQVIAHITCECPSERKGHTNNLAGIPQQPESEAIPAFFRKNATSEEVDLLEKHGALQELLR